LNFDWQALRSEWRHYLWGTGPRAPPEFLHLLFPGFSQQ